MGSNDIYICYPSTDKDSVKQFDHWIKKFSKYLTILLERILPESPNIVLCEDFKVEKKEDFYSIVDKQEEIPILLLIISPELIARKDYSDNIQTILAQIKSKTKSLSSKVFKVSIAPTILKSQPELLKDLINYDLYDKELLLKEGEPVERDLLLEPDTTVWFKLVDLAYDVLDSIKRGKAELSKSDQYGTGKQVFLAETTKDQDKNRDILKRELMQFGYRMAPANPIPSSPGQAETVIIESIKHSELAIHVVGNEYGELMENADFSLVEFQIDKISKAEKGTRLKQIIWLPPDLKPVSEQQQQFIGKLKRLEQVGKSIEIVQTPIEILKTIIKKNLSSDLETKKTTQTVDFPDEPFVYLIHEKLENQEMNTILPWLKKSDIPFVTSGALAVEKKPVKLHRKFLVHCEGVLIYYSGNNWPWINSKLMDMLKAPGYGRNRPFKAKALMVRKKYDDPLFKMKDLDIIEIKNDSPPESFKFFREKLNQ